MADKPELNTFSANSKVSVSKINENFEILASAVESALGLGGINEQPNSMNGDLDMNLYSILNLSELLVKNLNVTEGLTGPLNLNGNSISGVTDFSSNTVTTNDLTTGGISATNGNIDFITSDSVASQYISADSLSINGSEVIPTLPETSIFTVSETKVLNSAQVNVVFNNDIDRGVFYISGQDVDSSRLIPGQDYSLNLQDNTLVLTQSYPAGSRVVMTNSEESEAYSIPYQDEPPVAPADGDIWVDRNEIADTESDPIFVASEAYKFTVGDKAKLDGIEDDADVETLTSISHTNNTLSYTDENGTTTDIDLSIYLDDTNLSRLVSGTVDSGTGIATFTRDDATSFEVDFSALLGGGTGVTVEDNLTSTSTTNALSANQGRVLNESKVDNSRVLTDVPEEAVFTDTTYSALSEFTNDVGYITDVTGESIQALSDVSSTVSPADGEALIWDDTAGEYIPGAVSTSGGLSAVVDDTSPQLGGNLDCNGYSIDTISYNQIADASITGTHAFDYSSGDMQQVTVTGDVTTSFSNFVTGKLCTFIIDMVNGGDYAITWPAGTLFDSATAPTLTSGGTDRLLVTKDKDDVFAVTVIAAGLAGAA